MGIICEWFSLKLFFRHFIIPLSYHPFITVAQYGITLLCINLPMVIRTLRNELFLKPLLYLAGLYVLEILCWRYVNYCVFRSMENRAANRPDTAVGFNNNNNSYSTTECFVKCTGVILCTDLVSVAMKETETEREKEDMWFMTLCTVVALFLSLLLDHAQYLVAAGHSSWDDSDSFNEAKQAWEHFQPPPQCSWRGRVLPSCLLWDRASVHNV